MLPLERKKASFNKLDLSYLIYDGKANHENFLKQLDFVAKDPILKYDPSSLHQSRSYMMNVSAKKIMRLHEFHNRFPLDGSTEILKAKLFVYGVPFSMHGLMFLSTLSNLCDEQQVKMFLQPALRGQIIGCYAQTELAHGSDVQSLMTTATYDSTSQTFIINTPNVEAAKWWIGDLGLYCNHATVFAQLIINNKQYGVHAFLVPIRDPNTLKPFQGIEAGDVGPKLGFQNKDNGYAIFTNYRIPRRNMLMKYHNVSKEGQYSTKGDEKISYATMLLTRSGLTEITFYNLSKATTISVRYSLIRSQFKNSEGKEIPILDYQTQQEKIIPRIAQSYASLFCFKKIQQMGRQTFAQCQKGNFNRLNEAHILTSAAKAILSHDALKGMEIIRRAAGGHGFHLYNGIIGLMQEFSPVYTLQGQYTVLMLQVARFLMKSLSRLQKGKQLADSIKYLKNLQNGNSPASIVEINALQCPYNIRKILILHSCAKIQSAAKKIVQGLQKGLSKKQSWDTYAELMLIDAAVAHSYVVVYSYFLDYWSTITIPSLKTVMRKVLTLYGLQKIIERSTKFFETETLSHLDIELVYEQRHILFAELRPESLTLMEAFDYDDNILMSAIGTADGKAYENLIDWAKKYNTLNRKEERDELISVIKQAKRELKPHL